MFGKTKEETMFVVRMGYCDEYFGISIEPAVFRNLKDAERFVLDIFKDHKPKSVKERTAFDKYVRREYTGLIQNLETEREEYLDGWARIDEVRER